MIKYWLTKSEKVAVVIGTIGAFLARGLLLFTPSQSIDDYRYLFAPPSITTSLSQGRWGSNIIFELSSQIGLYGNFAPTLVGIISLLLLVIIGLITCRIWKINNNASIASIVILLFTTFPYQAEIFTFKAVTLVFIVGLTIAYLSVYHSKLNFLSTTLTAIGFSFSLSIYQISINYIAQLLLIGIIIEALRQFKPNISNFQHYIIKVIKESNILPQLLTISLGLLIYAITNKVILSALHITLTNRAELLSLSDISLRYTQLHTLLNKILFTHEGIFPLTTKIALLIVFGLSILGVTKRFFFKHKNNTVANLILLTILGLLVLSIITNIGVSIILEQWWPVPRVLIGMGTFWAGITSIAYLSSGKKIKTFIVIISTIITLSFISLNNHIYIDQIRVNEKDRSKANRILTRLEMDKDFENIIYISIIGKEWSYGNQITTVEGDMNISAFGAEWGKIPLLNETGGYNFLPSPKEQRQEAIKYCSTANNWPSEKSITIKGNHAIVCLTTEE